MAAHSLTKPPADEHFDEGSRDQHQRRTSFAEETKQEAVVPNLCWQASGSCRLKAHKALATVMVSMIDLLDRIARQIDSSPTILRDQVRDEFKRFEADLIKIALIHTNGTKEDAARLLSLSPSQMTGKMRIHGIDRESIALCLAYLINGD